MQLDEILRKLESLADPKAVEGMARYGITSKNVYGVSAPNLRAIAKEIGRNHVLAEQLWSSGVYEARIIAGLIDIPEMVTEEQMERWVKDFDSWAVCDGVCSVLFDKTKFGYRKALEWSERREEYVKRAGFVLMAALAVHDKKALDKEFLKFLPIIKGESIDERNIVKKAVNWALRQIGKRNARLNKEAIRIAEQIRRIDSKSARWIASDALRELTSPAVQKRLRR